LNDYETQIESLTRERANLLEEIQTNTPSHVQTTDNESQTDDRQHRKLVQANNKLKRVLETFKDKIHQVVTERPHLFVDVNEDTTDRFDHLISTVENQAKQLDVLQAQHDQAEEQLRGNIKELQE
jgi:predicted  nucleic acid-binding Zn-ribbon protein